MGLGQYGSGPSAAEVNGGNVINFDRFFAPVEREAPLEDADLRRHSERIMPGVARTMRNLTRGASEARSHAPHRTRKEVDQAKINTQTRRRASRLRQISRTTRGLGLIEDFDDGLLA